MVLAATVVAAAGCVYRPTIQQGNLLDRDQIEQVKVGMTPSQVRYILGTPMVSDPFSPDRWDYVYTLRVGRDEHVDRAHIVVVFEADKVKEIRRLGLQQDSEIALRVKEERRKRAEAEAKAAGAAGTPDTATPAADAQGGDATTTPAAPAPQQSAPEPAPETEPAASPPPQGG